jgi:hypothetical protein
MSRPWYRRAWWVLLWGAGCGGASSADHGVFEVCCAGLDQQICEGHPGCISMLGYKDDCRPEATYAGCRTLGALGYVGCSGEPVYAMHPVVGACFTFTSGCLPDGWVPCSEEPVCPRS